MLRYLLDILIALYVLKRRPMAPRPRSITKLFAPPWKKFGQPVCVNDTHIAAHVRSEGLVLVTNNMGEFARVAALEAENWVNASQ